MEIADRYLIRKLFQNRLYQADGQQFQDLFVQVMRFSNPEFQAVKPQGKYGDKKNDGFDPTNGIYYQIYGPEELKGNEVETIKKLSTDFYGAKVHWDSVCKIKEFYFVVNDKYKGVFPCVHQAAINLSNETGISVKPFGAGAFENTFMLLTEEQMYAVVGPPATIVSIDLINYSVLGEVVDYLLKRRVISKYKDSYPNLNFIEKIKINGLSEHVKALLVVAGYQVGNLEEYFANNSDFVKADLRDQFKDLYLNANTLIQPDHLSASNERFFNILENACPRESPDIQNAVLILMSYFFEACDLFEPPVTEV